MLNPNVEPLGQDYVIAAQVPSAQKYFFHDPNMTRLDDGALLIAAPQWNRHGYKLERRLRILRSEDGGLNWTEYESLACHDGTPFGLDGRLLMFVQEESHCDFQIVASEDGGRTWTKPQTVLEGPMWNISTAMLARPDTLYWAMDYDLPGWAYNGKVMVQLDRKKSPLDPAAWRMSGVVRPPEFPAELMRNMYPTTESHPQFDASWKTPLVWLEPNTVDVGGRIRVFARCVIDQSATASIASVFDYDEQSDQLSFTQFTAWPGAQHKFFIIHDTNCSMYWMLSNLVTNSQDLLNWGERMREVNYRGGPGNERRWMFLHYSIDCLNWFPAGCVARWPEHLHRSFMYPSAVVDGDDLVVLSRSSRDSGDQHDADLCTIHRVRDFRGLAMDLHGGGLHR